MLEKMADATLQKSGLAADGGDVVWEVTVVLAMTGNAECLPSSGGNAGWAEQQIMTVLNDTLQNFTRRYVPITDS